MIHKHPFISDYFLPRTLNEAREILDRLGDHAMIIGGGTAFAFLKIPSGVRTFVDLSRAGISGIRETPRSLVIGASATITDIMTHPLLRNHLGGVVPEAALCIGTTPLRNLITVGGSVSRVFYWSCLPPLLMAMKAKIRVWNRKNVSLSAEDFFTSNMKNGKHLGIIRDIHLPKPKTNAAAAFAKISRTATDFAFVNVAASVEASDGIIRDSRIVVGAITPKPLRLLDIEKALKNKPLSPEIINDAVSVSPATVNPRKDFRIRDGYSLEILPVILKRCLQTAFSRLKI